ncbi:cell wall hydrolase [Arsenicitalea aurantiaca]|uniref:Cell wall hydrolase n=1 Tax=Arsenicitalea aurantiaca TaxID=1783274 RepID=A0A433XFC7_9HYPH|nr:cell wall hydrolase [Arsenicitalea aurantiaca]
MRFARLRTPLAAIVAALSLSGCFGFGWGGGGFASVSEKECLMRAMYFESIRSSRDGMLAVGTVVMNRVQDDRYPSSICGVVGQKNQFAQGVLTRPMSETRSVALASEVADSIIRGQRHHGVRQAQHFHTAGLRFPYDNMFYVLEAGGNEFYEKRNPRTGVLAYFP